jgi:signal transduction histidine kinase
MSDQGLFEREKEVIASARSLLSTTGENENWIDHYAGLLQEFERLVSQSDRLLRIGDIMQIRLNNLREELKDEIENHKKTQAKKEEYQAQLFQAQKNEALVTLVGGIAHDINNMLQTILGFSELLLVGKAKDDPDYKRLQTIIRAGKGGAELVRKLMAFSQQSVMSPVNLDINDHITGIASLLSRSVPTNIDIDIALSNESAIIHADPGQLDDIIMNLSLNAIEAMPEGGKLSISTRTVSIDQESSGFNIGMKPGNYVMLSVTDTGKGMDETMMSRIFEPFFSTKERGAIKGTGLGLSVVKGSVESQDGYMTCESSIGKGSEFKLYFPNAAVNPGPK